MIQLALRVLIVTDVRPYPLCHMHKVKLIVISEQFLAQKYEKKA